MRDLNNLPQNLVENLIYLVQEKIKRDGKGKVNPSGKGSILCLYHEENNPSLHFNLYKGLIRCFGCGKRVSSSEFLRDLKESLGYDFASTDADYKKIKEVETKLPEVANETVFIYKDERGRPLCYKWRRDYLDGSKDFNLFNPDGEEISHFFGLYSLPLVARADEIYFVEGEKVADSLIELGLIATTLCRGASTKLSKPERQSLLFLKGKKVFLCPDADKSGFQYMAMVEKFLRKKGIETVFVKPPDNLTDGEDLYDYIQELRQQGLTEGEIRESITSLTNTPKPFEKAVDIEAKNTEWVIPKWFAKGKLSLIVGDPGVGKSTLAICLGLIKASGGVVPTDNGFERVESGKVLYVPFEEDPSEVSFIAKLQEISNWGDNFYVWTDAKNFNLNQLENENIELIIADPMTYIYAEKQRKDITADAYQTLKPYKQFAEKTECSIVFVWHTRKNKNDIINSVLSSRIISAMVKRIVFVEKEKDNIRRIFFEKGYPIPSMLFEIKDRMFNWIGVDDKSFDEFNDKIPKKEVVRLIREELQRNPDKSLPFNEIIKLVSPFGISKDYLIKIKSKYLPEVISEPVRRNGKFIGWFWKLPEGKSKVVRLARTLENTTFSPEGQFAYNIPQQELTDKKTLKINELEEQEKSDTKKIETVRLVESIDKSTFEPEGQSKTVRLVEMPKKNNNSLKNQDFFSLKVPIIPEELLEKYKIENPELYEDPDFRMFAVGHIISHSRQSKPDKPDELPVVVIDGVEYVDADELFKREGLAC